MAKAHVNGAATDPVWKFAKKVYPGEVTWNFAGIFLFDAHGTPSGRFSANQLSEVDVKVR